MRGCEYGLWPWIRIEEKPFALWDIDSPFHATLDGASLPLENWMTLSTFVFPVGTIGAATTRFSSSRSALSSLILSVTSNVLGLAVAGDTL